MVSFLRRFLFVYVELIHGNVSLRYEAEERVRVNVYTGVFVGYCEAFMYGVWLQGFIVTSKICFIGRFSFVAIDARSNISISEFL